MLRKLAKTMDKNIIHQDTTTRLVQWLSHRLPLFRIFVWTTDGYTSWVVMMYSHLVWVVIPLLICGTQMLFQVIDIFYSIYRKKLVDRSLWTPRGSPQNFAEILNGCPRCCTYGADVHISGWKMGHYINPLANVLWND